MASALDFLKECPVCQENFSDPRVLPCDHSFCQECIDQMKKGNSIKCPVCNGVHNVKTVRRDFRLMQFLEALKEEKHAKKIQKQGIATRKLNIRILFSNSTCFNHRILNRKQCYMGFAGFGI